MRKERDWKGGDNTRKHKRPFFQKMLQDPHLWMMGKRAVEEVLTRTPHRIQTLYLHKKPEEKSRLLSLAREHSISTEITSKEALAALVYSEHHQSVVARLHTKRKLTLKEWGRDRSREEGKGSLVLMIDSVTDPQNFGALLRAAECFGVDGVIFSKNRGCGLTPSVAKTSVGASEFLPLIEVSNLHTSMGALADMGYDLLAAVIDGEAVDLHSHSFAQKTVLIVGSEEKGVRPLLAKRSDRKVYIPMKGGISSLNVSQAAAILLSSYWRDVK